MVILPFLRYVVTEATNKKTADRIIGKAAVFAMVFVAMGMLFLGLKALGVF